MVPAGKVQDRERDMWWFQVKLWCGAGICIVLLSACFTASCWVTYLTYARPSDVHMSSNPTFREGTGVTAPPTEKTSSVNCNLYKSNPAITKLLLASLLILLLLAISFFVAFIFFFQKYSDVKGKISTKETFYNKLECTRANLTMKGSSVNTEKMWSCCPQNWKSFGSNCYFIASEDKSWNESEKNCSVMHTHLLVVTSREEQDFIISNVNKYNAYYVGLSDPEGKHQWQWVDGTPYNQSAAFWLPQEPTNFHDRCVILQFRVGAKWGWNNIRCNQPHKAICKTKMIYL